MAEVQEHDSGKKKKGAQKKMTIRVDFTPMVDMNMLLITFFMLCTTMIKSQTLQLTLPTNEKVQKEQQNQAKKSEALTLILDTEYTENNLPKTDEATGKTVHNVYWFAGLPDTTFQTNLLAKESFMGDTKENGVKVQQGIRKILREQNKDVMTNYDELKAQWKNREITKETFDSLAKKNAADSTLTRPVVIIKPGPNTTYEALINALDEMQINQIARYSIQPPTHTDTLLLENYQQRTGETVIRPTVRKSVVY
ncbi:MAG: biopolymer transporter ExbD [Bacteroidales bacterium]|nr:biopolymer transporter ExbD [Bacteroidales bacterium]